MRGRARLVALTLSCVCMVGLISARAQSGEEETLGRQAEQAGRLREALTHYTAALQNAPDGGETDQRLREKIIAVVQKIKPAPTVPEEARRHFVTGNTFVKNAKSASDYGDAAREYRQALLQAPWFADAYNNLGIALEASGDYTGAKRMLRLYLESKPSPPDSRAAQDKIYEIEAKVSLAEKQETARQQEIKQQEAEERKREAQQRGQTEGQSIRKIFASLSGTWKGCPGGDNTAGLIELGVRNGRLTYRGYDKDLGGFPVWPTDRQSYACPDCYFTLDENNGSLVWKLTGKIWFKIISADELEWVETPSTSACRYKRVQ